jgi:CsoR family transcriptional regulator, copper-sensing transcriptional repressor
MEQKIKSEVVRRLRRAAGQIKGLERMVEEEKYCVDILHQSLAVKEALSGFEDVILRNHLATHAAKQIKGRHPEKAVDEILSIYRLSRRK